MPRAKRSGIGPWGLLVAYGRWLGPVGHPTTVSYYVDAKIGVKRQYACRVTDSDHAASHTYHGCGAFDASSVFCTAESCRDTNHSMLLLRRCESSAMQRNVVVQKKMRMKQPYIIHA